MDKSVFTENRRKVFEQMDNNSVMVIFSRRGPDVTFQDRYEINRNYFYLTGVVEYGNILVMRKKDNKCLSTMFIHQFDELKAKWVGAPKTKEEIIYVVLQKDCFGRGVIRRGVLLRVGAALRNPRAPRKGLDPQDVAAAL
jgi:hypothetical protein